MMRRRTVADDRVGLLFGGWLAACVMLRLALPSFAAAAAAPRPSLAPSLGSLLLWHIYCVICFVSKRILELWRMDGWMEETWSELIGSQKITVIVVVDSSVLLSACLQSPTHSLAAADLLLLRSEANGVLCWLISITFYTSSFCS